MSLFKKNKIADNGKPAKKSKRTFPPIAIARKMLSEHAQSEVLGSRARAAISQLAELERVREASDDIVADRFGYASLTYGKFSTAIDEASKVVCANCRELSSKMDLFDVAEYKRLNSTIALIDAGSRNEDREALADRLALLDTALDKLDETSEMNKAIIAGINRLSKDIADSATGDGDIAAEIKSLVEELPRYTEALSD